MPSGKRSHTARSTHERRGRLETVRIWLLDGFRVSVGSRTITREDWRLRKAAALVKLLALAPGHRMHREEAMGFLWPDSGRRAASNGLRGTLHAARKVLDPVFGSLYLASEDEALVLCPGGDLWVDADAFEGAAAAARRSRDPAAYRATLELYPGDLLPDDRYEDWVENRRQELRGAFLSVLIELAGLYEERGDYERGVETLQRFLSVESTSEEAHAHLMRLHAYSGRQQEALSQYEQLARVLSGQFGTEPDVTTRRLRDEIAEGGFPSLTDSPQEEASDDGRHNLPEPKTSFVGREREMIEVKRSLTATRLMTLTGAGGSGKTRLALKVARDLAGSYADGVWLIELAPLSEPELVVQEVAGTLKTQEQPGSLLLESVLDALGDKEMLLILDNASISSML